MRVRLVRWSPAVAAVTLPMLLAAWPLTQGGDWVLNRDGSLYSALAEAVYKGQGYVLTDGSFPAFRPPLMATLGAVTWLFTGPSFESFVWTLRFFQVGAVAVAAAIGWQLEGAAGALLVGLLYAASPLLNEDLNLFIRPDGVLTVFSLAALAALISADRRSSQRRAALAGIMVGLAFLTKQTAAAWLMLPLALWAVGPTSSRRLTTLVTFVIAGLPFALAWYWVAVWNGVGFAGGLTYPALGLVTGALITSTLVVFHGRWSGWIAGRLAIQEPRWQRWRRWAVGGSRLLAGLAFLAGLRVLIGLASRERIEVPRQLTIDLLSRDLADLSEAIFVLPWLAWVGAAGLLLAFIRRGGREVVVAAVLAAIPVVYVALRYDLREGQYSVVAALLIVAAGTFLAHVLRLAADRLGRVTSPPAGALATASLLAITATAVAVSITLPSISAEAARLRNLRSPNYARAESIAAAAGWLRETAPPGVRIAFDDDSFRQMYVDLDGAYPLLMVPQSFAWPARQEVVRLRAFVDIAKLGRPRPSLEPPVLVLTAWGEERYYVVLEEARFVAFLTNNDVKFLVTTGSPPFGLGRISAYLGRQPGLSLVFHHEDPFYPVSVYRVEGEALRVMGAPLYTDRQTLRFLSSSTGRSVDQLVRALSPAGAQYIDAP